LHRAFEVLNTEVYELMWGPSELAATGTLKDYEREAALPSLNLPVLFTAGRYDEATPESVEYYRSLVPGSEIAILEDSAHMTMLDEPEAYIDVVRDFLNSVDLGR
jgi:proline iminopeptidase